MHNFGESKGVLIVLSSPSGAGKTSLAHSIVAERPNIVFSVSVTTRQPRIGEIEGREYFFTNRQKFEKMVLAGDFIENAEVFGNFYGTPLLSTESLLKDGKDVIFDLDWQGGTQIRNSHLSPSVISIFILPPSIKSLQDRLYLRAQDDEKTVHSRMLKAQSEISHWGEYDYILVNDNFSEVKETILKIVDSEKLRRHRQPGLAEFVNTLNSEFNSIIPNK